MSDKSICLRFAQVLLGAALVIVILLGLAL